MQCQCFMAAKTLPQRGLEKVLRLIATWYLKQKSAGLNLRATKKQCKRKEVGKDKATVVPMTLQLQALALWDVLI